ncbi:MAG: DUF6515 family protein [Verrucomicrobiota bacterium JB022]|nr:DUF6515 family protein [Verrucomicrobiota bacterium JB022]
MQLPTPEITAVLASSMKTLATIPLLALALSLSTVPAFARDRDRHDDHDRHDGHRHRDDRWDRHDHDRDHWHYRPPVRYVPPPVRYVPAPPSSSVTFEMGIPNGFISVRVGQDYYYERRGVYYRHLPQGYVVVPAPRGAIIPILPPGYRRVVYNDLPYYRCGDVYYRSVSGGYMVVERPVVIERTVVVESRPAVAEPPTPTRASADYSFWIDSYEFTYRDGQFFRRTASGLIWNEPPMGAVSNELPADAESLWYRDIEYFDLDGVYLRKTQDGYKIVPAPWSI